MRKNNVDGDLEVGNFLQMNADHKDLKPSWDLWEIRGIVDDVYLIRRRGKCYRATECASVRRCVASGKVRILKRDHALKLLNNGKES